MPVYQTESQCDSHYKTVKTMFSVNCVVVPNHHQEVCLSISLLALDRYKDLPGIGVIAT